MALYTPHQIYHSIIWETKPTREQDEKIVYYILDNIEKLSKLIEEALSQGQTQVNIDPNNLITIN